MNFFQTYILQNPKLSAIKRLCGQTLHIEPRAGFYMAGIGAYRPPPFRPRPGCIAPRIVQFTQLKTGFGVFSGFFQYRRILGFRLVRISRQDEQFRKKEARRDTRV
jgi:hypothetical protein